MKFERSDKNVSTRVFKGALYLAGARLVLRMFSLVNLVVLGRLLAPDDYGVASLAIVVIGITQVFSDMRVNSALIALRDVDAGLLNTGFTMNLMRGLVIALGLFAFAGPIATYMNEPKLELVLRIICMVLIFDGLRNPAFMMYQRNIDFSMEFRRRTAATVLGSLAAVTFAVLTKSYWAIVAGTIAGRFTEMALSYWRIPHRVRFSLDRWRTFFGFGSWLTLSGIISYLTLVAPRLLMGKYLGADQLGYFTVGRDVADIATREVSSPLTQALTPGLSAIAQQKDRLQSAYRRAQSTILGIAMPIGVGTALMSKELIAILVGVKWLPSADVVLLLAPVSAFAMISAATDSLAMAKLATRAMFNRAVFVAAISLPLYFVAVTYYGFTGVLYAVAFRVLLQTAVNMYFAKTLLGDAFLSPFYVSWRTMVSAAVMAIVVHLVPAAFHPGQEEHIVLIGMLPRILLGAGVYILVHLILWNMVGRPEGFESKMQEFLRLGVRKLRSRLGGQQA